MTGPAALRAGVRVAGHLRAESGVGEAGRQALAALQAAGIPAGSWVWTDSPSRQDHPFEDLPGESLLVNLVAVNADLLPAFARAAGPEFFAGRYTIGLWAWELEEFPVEEGLRAAGMVDEIWAVSSFTARAIEPVAGLTPVLTFPNVVSPSPARAPASEVASWGLPDGFVFLFCVDLLSVLERKNPLGLIDAFSRAFRPGQGPSLVVKVLNGPQRPDQLALLRAAARRRPDIVLWEDYLTAAQNTALMARCDCYVSLHRSEGFGLTMAEAMALGRPVIATGYSGNLDFMGPGEAFLVPWTYGTVPAGAQPYPAGARWAEPSLAEAARLMRLVVDDPRLAAQVAARGQARVRAHHTPGARTAFLRERLAHAERVMRRVSP